MCGYRLFIRSLRQSRRFTSGASSLARGNALTRDLFFLLSLSLSLPFVSLSLPHVSPEHERTREIARSCSVARTRSLRITNVIILGNVVRDRDIFENTRALGARINIVPHSSSRTCNFAVEITLPNVPRTSR